MEQFIPVIGAWFWWIAAGILLILELLLPGVFLFWLGIAAAITGLVDLVFGLGWQAELLVFAAAAAVSVFVGRSVMARSGGAQDHQTLNKRQHGYIGQSYVLKNAIVANRGRLTIEDTTWEIQGPDLPAGTRVKVTAAEGTLLTVEAAGN